MKNLIQKELLLTKRVSLWFIIGNIFVSIIFMILWTKSLADNPLLKELAKIILKSLIVLYPTVIITLVSNTTFSTNLGEEKRQGIIRVLIANGISVKKIWTSKVLAVLIVGEIVNLLVSGFGILIFRFFMGELPRFNGNDCLFLLLIMPFLGCVLASLMCVLTWVSRVGQMMASLLPFCALFGCALCAIAQIDLMKFMTWKTGIGMLAGSFLILYLSIKIIGRVSKEYISNQQ